jgi:hypothetical protein
MNSFERRRHFTIVHYINFIAICLQFITRSQQKSDKRVQSPYSGEYVGDYPGLHSYIRNRAMMEKPNFEAYLSEKYSWWKSNYYKNEDTSFFNFFTRELMQEIIQLEEEWADPAIELETTLSRIISFFMKHLVCYSPKQTFLILMHILSSKCFYIDRKHIAKKWDEKRYDPFSEVLIKKDIRIQSFFYQTFVNFIICNPSLLPEIEKLGENDARIFGSISVGFKMLTTLFLKKNVPVQSLPYQLQQQICVSSCNLWYALKQDGGLLWYQMMSQKFYSIQNMDQKFRRFLIGRGQFLFVLVWRMLHQSELNKIDKISRSMCTKLMLTRRFFHRMFPENYTISRFLSKIK